MKIKTLFIGMLAVAMLLCMTACGSSVKETTESTPAQASDRVDADTEPNDSEDKEQQYNNQNTGISER